MCVCVCVCVRQITEIKGLLGKTCEMRGKFAMHSIKLYTMYYIQVIGLIIYENTFQS